MESPTLLLLKYYFHKEADQQILMGETPYLMVRIHEGGRFYPQNKLVKLENVNVEKREAEGRPMAKLASALVSISAEVKNAGGVKCALVSSRGGMRLCMAHARRRAPGISPEAPSQWPPLGADYA